MTLGLLLSAVLLGISPTMAGPPVGARASSGLSVNGVACAGPDTCLSGYCTNSVCCNTACGSACDACSIAAGASVDGTCATVADAAAGSPSCTPYLCDGSGVTCPSTCAADVDCASGYVCSGGGACVPNSFTAMLTSDPGTECASTTITASGGETITQTRASNGYCTDSSGVMTLRSSNEARVSNKGVLVEGERTNYLARSEEVGTAPWGGGGSVVADQAAPPWGGTTMDAVTTTTVRFYDCGTVSSSTGPWAVSAYGAATSGTNVNRIELICNTSGTASGINAFRDDGTTASITQSGAFAWANVSFSTTVDRLQVNSGCSVANTSVCLGTFGGNTAGTHYWGGAQLEAGAGASSYIPTTATSVARSADVLSLAPSVAISTEGCVSGTATFAPVAVANARLIGGAAATGIYVVDANTVAIGDGTNTVSVDPGDLTLATYAFRATWTGSTLTLTVNGVSASGSFDGNMDMGTVYLGSQQGTSNHLFGWLKNVKLGASATGCTL